MEELRKQQEFSVSVDDIRNLPDASPEFRIWAGRMMSKGYLDLIVRALLASDVAKNASEALTYLVKASGTADFSDLNIACCDLKGRVNPKHFKELETLIAKKQQRKGDPFLVYGTISHRFLPRLLSGQPLIKPFKPERQLGLFATRPKQLQLFDWFQPKASRLFGENASKRLNFRRIEKNWRHIVGIMKKNSDAWPDWYLRCKSQVTELFDLMFPLFGEHGEIIKRYQSVRDTQYTVLMLLTWAAIIQYFRKNKNERVLFTEIPVFPHGHRISGGRLDALEIISINGEPPDKRQFETLRFLSKYRFKSVENLINELGLVFGRHTPIAFKVPDWKFTVGDSDYYNGQLILPEIVPLPRHTAQLQKYLTLLSFITRSMDGEEESVWQEQRFRHGQLLYLYPTKDPETYDILMEPEAKEETFLTEYVSKWSLSQRNAIIRTQTNLLLGHVIKLLQGRLKTLSFPNGNDNSSHNGKNKNGHEPASLFPHVHEKKSSVVDTIKKYRETMALVPEDASAVPQETLLQYDREIVPELTPPASGIFIDPLGIIEKLGTYAEKRTGQIKDKLVMHFDKLEEAVIDGKVATKGGFRENGWNVSCLMPEHLHDIHPSMRVDLSRGIFHCFVCGEGGTIVSVPEKIKDGIKASPYGRLHIKQGYQNFTPSAKTIDIPDEHRKIMNDAQMILQSQFKKSPGEAYLKRERYLNPDVAYEHGAGFGNDALICELMKSIGWRYDDLIKYGFVGISENIRPNSQYSLMPLLKKLGMDETGAKREVKLILGMGQEKQIQAKDGYPYFGLRGRVTFPLTLNKIITNFYGRATYPCSKQFSHFKLTTAQTGIPHGLFNEKVLESTADEIIITEAVLESLTLIAMGFKNTAAMIGLKNYIIMETIAETGKYVAIALNNDPPNPDGSLGWGQKATNNLIKDFSARAVITRNFTKWFLSQHEMAKDFNATWVNEHKRL